MKRSLIAAFALFTSALSLGAHAEEPDALVKRISNDILAEVQTGTRDPAKLKALVEERAIPHIDFAAMTQRVLARHYDSASKSQINRAEALFKNLATKAYVGVLTEYQDEKIIFNRFRGTRGNKAVVSAEVEPKTGPPISIEFLLHDKGAGWKMYDVKADGISLISSLRREYGKAIKKDGLEKTLSNLEAKGL